MYIFNLNKAVSYNTMETFRKVCQTEEELKTIFVSSCIESAAKSAGCSVSEMYKRMKRVEMIEKYIWEFYDVLHTQSRKFVTDDVLNTLKIWEEKAGLVESK